MTHTHFTPDGDKSLTSLPSEGVRRDIPKAGEESLGKAYGFES